MKRILFVDDEPKVLEGLRRMLYAYRNDWEMVFVGSGHEALKALAESHFDVLITDVRMPEMNGIQLLTEVVDRYPEIVRMVLSGQSDQDITLSSVTLAHQYLAKPCDATVLRATVDRALNLRIMLNDPALKQIVSRVHSLPSVPMVYSQLIKAVQSPNATPKEIGQIIAKDLAMSAKVLQLVNSSFFGVQRRITSPTEAVIYLGTETVKALALTVSVFTQFDTSRVPSFSLETLRNNGVAVGSLAQQIAQSLNLSKSEVEDAFMGGLLHELGRLVLACHYPEQYEAAILQAKHKGISIKDAEFEVFGTTHAQVGAYLLWLWGLPEGVTDIVARYERLGSEPLLAPLLAVHVANALLGESPEQNMDMECLVGMGVVAHLPAWKQLSEAIKQGDAA
jgi:HD-like signal output (HDOD) protein